MTPLPRRSKEGAARASSSAGASALAVLLPTCSTKLNYTPRCERRRKRSPKQFTTSNISEILHDRLLLSRFNLIPREAGSPFPVSGRFACTYHYARP